MYNEPMMSRLIILFTVYYRRNSPTASRLSRFSGVLPCGWFLQFHAFDDMLFAGGRISQTSLLIHS